MIKPKDKNILIIAGVCGAVVSLFWALIYFPANKRMCLLRSELAYIRNEVSQIESRTGRTGQDLVRMMDSLQKDLKEAAQKLPEQEKETLRLLAEEANRQGLELVSMSPAPRRPHLEQNSPVFLEGKQCLLLPVSMTLKGLYMSVGKYLEVLRERFPTLITVEEIKLYKEEAIAPRLRVNLELTIYLLCQR